ncbi:hypothetical protein M8571_000253 [Escherichia coli]|nr:hypothetical protein [Escherichia coli]EJF7538747.1 hypothetical protein [Escherichia coli]MCC4138435.1 hypothetical protein [Escherichia coli]MCC4161934.1 hypothetical protein [Escherichia coli]MCV4398547.1 hypothetical protein [Escherichia coli]MCY0099570.1 hypothetical protein [Escherichia coli]
MFSKLAQSGIKAMF